jgi:hypothetical protein
MSVPLEGSEGHEIARVIKNALKPLEFPIKVRRSPSDDDFLVVHKKYDISLAVIRNMWPKLRVQPPSIMKIANNPPDPDFTINMAEPDSFEQLREGVAYMNRLYKGRKIKTRFWW